MHCITWFHKLIYLLGFVRSGGKVHGCSTYWQTLCPAGPGEEQL
uniref:Uncharacterized protein n=1 Tax=Anguilla anguilla TaxID=7936 RepID=A0A0E9PZV3_ANGAN